MKIIHTSDWHYGMPAGSSAYRTYEENQRSFLKQLCGIIEQEKADAVLCSGDVYDSGLVNAAAIELYNDTVTEICVHLSVPLILIAGNHDSAPRLSACRELLRSAGLYVTGRLTRDTEPVLIGNAAIYPLPYFNRDEVSALFPEHKEQIRSMESAFQVVCDHIRETMDPNRKNIILAHAYVVGAELSDSDRSAQVGHAAAVSKDVFKGFDYVALGHIHKPQIIASHIRYCGSPLTYSFGTEESQEKGVVLLDTDTMEQRFIPIKAPHRHLTVRDSYENIIQRKDLAENYLALEIVDRYAGLELFSDLKERFPYLISMKGMSLNETEQASVLQAEDFERLDEMDIMKKFMAENFQCEPTQAQIDLFADVLAWSETVGEEDKQ